MLGSYYPSERTFPRVGSWCNCRSLNDLRAAVGVTAVGEPVSVVVQAVCARDLAAEGCRAVAVADVGDCTARVPRVAHERRGVGGDQGPGREVVGDRDRSPADPQRGQRTTGRHARHGVADPVPTRRPKKVHPVQVGAGRCRDRPRPLKRRRQIVVRVPGKRRPQTHVGLERHLRRSRVRDRDVEDRRRGAREVTAVAVLVHPVSADLRSRARRRRVARRRGCRGTLVHAGPSARAEQTVVAGRPDVETVVDRAVAVVVQAVARFRGRPDATRTRRPRSPATRDQDTRLRPDRALTHVGDRATRQGRPGRAGETVVHGAVAVVVQAVEYLDAGRARRTRVGLVPCGAGLGTGACALAHPAVRHGRDVVVVDRVVAVVVHAIAVRVVAGRRPRRAIGLEHPAHTRDRAVRPAHPEPAVRRERLRDAALGPRRALFAVRAIHAVRTSRALLTVGAGFTLSTRFAVHAIAPVGPVRAVDAVLARSTFRARLARRTRGAGRALRAVGPVGAVGAVAAATLVVAVEPADVATVRELLVAARGGPHQNDEGDVAEQIALGHGSLLFCACALIERRRG